MNEIEIRKKRKIILAFAILLFIFITFCFRPQVSITGFAGDMRVLMTEGDTPTPASNPDIVMWNITKPSSLIADTSNEINITINVTNGNGTAGLGTWSVNVTLWETIPKGPNISTWDSTSSSTLRGAGESITDLGIADFDNDGDIDIVAGGSDQVSPGELFMFNNTGSANISNWKNTSISTAKSIGGIAVADFDGDGDTDITFVDNNWGGDNKVYILNNTGTINISSWPSTSASLGTDVPILAVAAADFDNDGDIDIVTSDARTGTRYIYMFNNTGTINISDWLNTSTPAPNAGNSALYWLSPGDFDNDGDIDIATGSNNKKLTIYNNPGTTNISEWGSTTSGSLPFQLVSGAIGDLDGDGDLDIATSYSGGVGFTYVSIWNNTGTIDITQWTSTQILSDTSIVFIKDIDGDGDNDIVSTGAGDIVTLWNNTGGMDITTWTAINASLSDAGTATATADFDNDGDEDILIGTNKLHLFNNSEVSMTYIGSQVINFTNASGTSATYSIDWTPSNLQSYTLTAIADLTGTYAEVIENNNHIVASANVNENADPSITLISPENGYKSLVGSITFTYNVSDASDITSCSLMINDVYNQTDTSITKNTEQSFSGIDIGNGYYDWYVTCIDALSNQNSSETRSFTIAIPESTTTRRGGGIFTQPTSTPEIVDEEIRTITPEEEEGGIGAIGSYEEKKVFSIISILIVLIILSVIILLFVFSRRKEPSRLEQYIKTQLDKGYDYYTIKSILFQYGWSEEQVDKVFNQILQSK